MAADLVVAHPAGLYCPPGDFFIDPWQPVHRAVITHAHSDHASSGSQQYLAVAESEHLLRMRLDDPVRITTTKYGETQSIQGVQLSFHPAGHILGSAQVRLEHQGQVCVVTGDFKTAPDPTCPAFEVIPCHTLVTESTFGLPVFRWSPAETVIDSINDWWRANQAAGRASVIYGYSIGKAQRILASVDETIGPIFTHGAVQRASDIYRAQHVPLPATRPAVAAPRGMDWSQALIVAPPSAHATPWLRRFGTISTALASGWMRIRGIRRRRAIDRGFVLSDHVDWSGLLDTIRVSRAETVLVTHGYSTAVVHHLQQLGYAAQTIDTPYVGESIEDESMPEIDGPDTAF